MSKIGQSILQGASEALDYANGNKRGFKTHKVHVPKKVDVRAIRESTNADYVISSVGGVGGCLAPNNCSSKRSSASSVPSMSSESTSRGG
jgi:hypothetical protein